MDPFRPLLSQDLLMGSTGQANLQPTATRQVLGREIDSLPAHHPEEGYMAGPLAPPPVPVSTPPRPLPESVRGDSWNWAELPASALREAAGWPIGFRKSDLIQSFLVSNQKIFDQIFFFHMQNRSISSNLLQH